MERVDPGGVPPAAEPAYGVVRARPSVGGIPVIAAQLMPNPPTPMQLRLDPDPEPEPEPQTDGTRPTEPEPQTDGTRPAEPVPHAAAVAAQANQAARVAQLKQ